MNATDQPDDEQRAAHYTRREAADMPKTPDEQAAHVEALLDRAKLAPTRHNRAALARLVDRPDDPKTRLMADMLDLLNQHEREQAAARAAKGDTNPYDLDEYEPVRDLADYYAEHRDDPERLEPFLDQLAAELDLADIRALRLAGEAAERATSRAIKAARDRGMKPPRIADLLGLTPSRIYQVLRELAAAEVAEETPPVGEYRLSTTGGHEWHRETPTAGRRCRRCGLPHSQWSGERCTGSNDQ